MFHCQDILFAERLGHSSHTAKKIMYFTITVFWNEHVLFNSHFFPDFRFCYTDLFIITLIFTFGKIGTVMGFAHSFLKTCKSHYVHVATHKNLWLVFCSTFFISPYRSICGLSSCLCPIPTCHLL